MAATATKEDVQTHISEAIASFGVPREQVTPDATWEELDVDSLDLVELAQIAEEDYSVELAATDMGKVKTVGEAVDLIYSRMG
jgi:acyl carrier protein